MDDMAQRWTRFEQYDWPDDRSTPLVSDGDRVLSPTAPQNGPLQVTGTFSIKPNNFSWNKLADTFWIDQPGSFPFSFFSAMSLFIEIESAVGTGYSTSDATGYGMDVCN
jgi:hypothetical protein